MDHAVNLGSVELIAVPDDHSKAVNIPVEVLERLAHNSKWVTTDHGRKMYVREGLYQQIKDSVPVARP